MAAQKRAPLPAPPDQLVGDGGDIVFGNFGGVPRELGLQNVDYEGLRRPPWNRLRWTAEKLLKRWQFVGAMDERYVVGAAVAHVQYLASGFAYVYDRRTGVFTERNFKTPAALGARFSETPARGDTTFALGSKRIRLGNTPGPTGRSLDVEVGDLEIHLRYREEGTGVSTCSPQVDGGLHYTYKFAGLPVEGTLRVGGRQVSLTPGAQALLDWTASTPPRATTWNWSCAVGKDDQGRRVALNFSEGLVRGGHTQNTVWVDGQPTLLSTMDFAYDPERIVDAPWRLTTKEGTVDLTFHPASERFENIDLKIVASRLHQPFGRFEGTFRVGEETIAAELFGFCEEHYAKW